MDEPRQLIALSADITGNLAGTTAGLLVAGPPGAVVGATIEPLIRLVASEFLSRSLSKREKIRVGAGYTYAINQIWQRLIKGQRPRDDGFFQARTGDRSAAEEIFEGILLKCKTEHEEKKLPYVANIFANSAFMGTSPSSVNTILRMAEAMSYRQICILSLFGRSEEFDVDLAHFDDRAITRLAEPRNGGTLETPVESDIRPDASTECHVLASELQELGFRVLDLINNSGSRIGLTEVGRLSFELMGLGSLPRDDLSQLMKFAVKGK